MNTRMTIIASIGPVTKPEQITFECDALVGPPDVEIDGIRRPSTLHVETLSDKASALADIVGDLIKFRVHTPVRCYAGSGGLINFAVEAEPIRPKYLLVFRIAGIHPIDCNCDLRTFVN